MYFAAVAQLGRLVAGVRPDQLDAATPCSEYDVRALLGHLLAGLRRVTAVGTGSEALDRLTEVTGIPDDGWSSAYQADEAALREVWADDALLDRVMTLPFGTMPGRGALGGFLIETATHGWDLAAATGQEAALDPGVAEAALELARQFIPAEPRGGPMPFGSVVPVPEGRGPYAQLAGWLGRSPEFAATGSSA